MANESPRKLIKFGNSSFIISLPKEWIERNNLGKGDLIYITDNEGDLVINSKENKKSPVKTTITLSIDNKNFDELRREVTSAYISNYNEIIFEGKNKKQRREAVSEAIKEIIGLEIVDHNNSQTIVKDILDLRAISFEKITRRLDNVIRSMFEDIGIVLQNEDFKSLDVKGLKSADTEVNKLYFLIWKVVRKCQEEHAIAKELKISTKELSDMQWFSLHMEYIGDSLKRIAKLLSSQQIDPKGKKKIVELICIFERDYLKAINSHYTNDKQTARKIATMKKTHQKMCTELISFYPSCGSAGEKLRALADAIHNIAKIIAY